MYPVLDPHVTTVPPRRTMNTEIPKVDRPTCSKTMSGSAPTAARTRRPSRFPAAATCPGSSPVSSPMPISSRLTTTSHPSLRAASAFSSEPTTPTAIPPPFFTNWAAYAPSPPDAPQISTTSPCFIRAPRSLTSIRYAVPAHAGIVAASSHVKWAGLGMSWLARATE